MIEERLEICRHCPIYDKSNSICNGSLYLNPENNDVRVAPKKGYIKGCGCFLTKKVLKAENHCPANKW